MRNHSSVPPRWRQTALAVALGLSFGGSALAQSTTGSILGTAPIATGETVRITNKQTGLTREVPVDANGRYAANTLPVGDYSVALIVNGTVAATQENVSVSVSGPATVPFTAAPSGAQNLSGVTVTAGAIPPIDVASTRQTAVITDKDLKVLPLDRDAESIALLAPGVALGAGSLGTGPAGTPLVSFSGNSVVENAYYINGFNTTDPVGNAGGIALPYFAIAEQQTITSGYGAEYGRSTGGVISQVGERGGNDWHFGAYVSMQPAWAESQYSNLYYSNPNSTTTGEKYGDIYENRSNDKDWVNIYDAYISGPLIKDKLFFYLTVEGEHTQEDRTTNVTAPNYESHSFSSPKFYGKLDWNINDSNTVEFTGIQSKREDQANNYYDYDYSTNKIGAFNSVDNPLYSSKFSVGILKYTSYITDDLTLSVLYGKMWSTYYNQDENYAGYDSELAGVAGVDEQNPDVSGYGNYNNNPTTQSSPGHESRQANLRVDLDWKLGDHDIKFGIDNVRSTDVDDGTTTAGPGYYWSYGQASTLNASTPLLTNGNNYVANPVNYANGASGYYVAKVVYGATASFTVTQRAQYIEDNWQATPNLLLNIGIRNDQFTNYNAANEPYIRETKPQWQPRLGFSWDIFGDGTSKLYGNVGRYYLALPSGLGVRMAGENSYTETYYTYSSINANGIPQGLTQIYASRDPFSADGEYGTAKNASTVAAKNLKPEYQDEFVLGFQKQLGDTSLVWTNQLTYEKLRNIVDDTGDIYLPDGEEDDVLVNPGSTEDIYYVESNGSTGTLKWNPATASDGTVTGFPKPKRDYYGLEEALERPWDGKWMAKVDYVLARSWGNTEGPTNSATGQITSASGASGGGQSGSITTAWDYPTLMQYSGGELANSHRHTLKTFGTYAITPEWLISGTYIIQSGAPNVCLGYYGTAQTNPIGYGSSYHWCGGEPSRPGDSGHTPWTHQINLSLNYIPNWADKHLTFQVQVHNLLNEQNALQYYATYGSTSAPYPLYKTIEAIEQPRYMQISAKYDW